MRLTDGGKKTRLWSRTRIICRGRQHKPEPVTSLMKGPSLCREEHGSGYDQHHASLRRLLFSAKADVWGATAQHYSAWTSLMKPQTKIQHRGGAGVSPSRRVNAKGKIRKKGNKTHGLSVVYSLSFKHQGVKCVIKTQSSSIKAGGW